MKLAENIAGQAVSEIVFQIVFGHVFLGVSIIVEFNVLYIAAQAVMAIVAQNVMQVAALPVRIWKQVVVLFVVVAAMVVVMAVVFKDAFFDVGMKHALDHAVQIVFPPAVQVVPSMIALTAVTILAPIQAVKNYIV